MNIFLKILAIAVISFSFKSIGSDAEVLQDQESSLNTNGEVVQNQIDSVISKATVKLGIKIDVNKLGITFNVDKSGMSPDPNKLFWGMGVFVGPHTLMTVFHNISDLREKEKVSDHIFIVHPITKKRIPATFIRALDVVNDLAVLHVANYRSPFFITPEMFEDSTKSLASSQAYFFNRKKVFSPKLIGTVSSRYDSEYSFKKALLLHANQEETLEGLSGSPLVSKEDNKMIGVITEHERSAFHSRVSFIDIQSIKTILLKTPLNCESGRCIHDELAANSHIKEAQYQQGMLEYQRLLSFVTLISDERLREEFILGQKGLMYRWFTASAKQGFAPAMYELAKLYINEQNIRELSDEEKLRNIKESNKWMLKAAENDYGYAQLYLSMYLLNKRGSFEEGIEWAQKAMEHGYFIPTLTLFNLVTEQVITMRKYLYHLEDFAKRGHLEAQMELAHYFFKGDTVDRDIQKAMTLLLQAVEKNDPTALKYLSRIYKEGLYGEEQDIEKAESLEQKAREFGYVDIKEREVKPIAHYIREFVSSVVHIKGFQQQPEKDDTTTTDGLVGKITSRVRSATVSVSDSIAHSCQHLFEK